jgi:hypothetical protein
MKVLGSRFGTFALAFGLTLAGRESSASTVTWNVVVEGCQEVPPNVTSARGDAAFTYDTVTNVLGYNITFSGLSSPELFAHIHGPAARGVDGGILFTLPNGSPKVGTVNVPEANESDLLAGLLYVNVHSNTFPGGEIRGQIDTLGACTDALFEDGFEGLTAFRITEMYLRDPHVFVTFVACNDVTNGAVGSQTFNGQMNAQLQGDGNGDGNYDWSPVLVFRPLAPQTAATPVDLVMGATCSIGAGSTCAGAGAAYDALVANNQAVGTCVGVLVGTTTDPYTPEVTTPSGPCFGTTAQTLLLPGFAATPLYDARIGGVYQGDPVTGIVNGLIRGFVTEADAENTVVTLPTGTTTLAALLPGGRNCCRQPWPQLGDKDTGPGGLSGWYFYFNFSAVRTPYTN